MGEFEKALNKYAKYVIQQARSNLTKGKQNASKELYNSLSYKVQKKSVLFDMPVYGAFQDEGVKGTKSNYIVNKNTDYSFRDKMPPAKPFEKWIKQKGIQGRDKKTGRFISRQSLSYIIARSIYNKGIRATMFFTKPFEAGLDKFSDEIVLGFIDDNLKLE
jgi:hypothetical protein